MNTYRMLMAGAILLLTELGAETPPPATGYIEIVNLMKVNEPTYLTLNQFKLNGGRPLQAGYVSGCLALAAGHYELHLANEAATPRQLSQSIEVIAGGHTTVVCFTEREEDQEIPQARIESLSHTKPPDSPELILVSWLEEHWVSVEINKQHQALQQGQAVRSHLVQGNPITIDHKNKRLGTVEVEAIARYYVLLYDHSDGSGAAMLQVTAQLPGSTLTDDP